jgi:hypothetical protein
MFVEADIGYGGTCAQYGVSESYAWMHTVYGAQSSGDPHSIDGRLYDAVIPNYCQVDDFPFSADKDDYFLHIGRLIDRKGWHIAQEFCDSSARASSWLVLVSSAAAASTSGWSGLKSAASS